MNPLPDTAIGIPSPREGVDMTPARCVVLVPHQGRIVSRCQAGLVELERRGYIVRRVEGYSAIDQARNQLASDALRDGFDETLWIDSDVAFEPNDVEKLRRHRLPISCGVYPKKGKRELAMHILPGTERFLFGVHGGLNEVLYAGTGFLHIRREAHETIARTLELPICNQHTKHPLCPFFQPLVRPWQGGQWYLAEDYAFCYRARQCGLPIIADTAGCPDIALDVWVTQEQEGFGSRSQALLGTAYPRSSASSPTRPRSSLRATVSPDNLAPCDRESLGTRGEAELRG